MSQKPILVITGPTASGKSATALYVAQALDGEIIGADSMQIYRQLDIGSAKPTLEERFLVRHHLVDCIELSTSYSVSDYAKMAQSTIEDIQALDKVPIVCGGTGQYISAIIQQQSYDDLPFDSALRAKLHQKTETESGRRMLWSDLIRLDPKAPEYIHPNNIKRVVRALEILYLTGKPQREYRLQANESDESKATQYLTFVINHDRTILYDRINQRVDEMIKEGLLEEAQFVLEQSLPSDATCLQAIGYKELFPYLNGSSDLETCVNHLKQSTRRYAKRQITWYKHQIKATWINNMTPEAAGEQIIKAYQDAL